MSDGVKIIIYGGEHDNREMYIPDKNQKLALAAKPSEVWWNSLEMLEVYYYQWNGRRDGAGRYVFEGCGG